MLKYIRLYFLFLLFISCIVFQSCSLYPPISESIIFEEDLYPTNSSQLIFFPRVALSYLSVNPKIPERYLSKNNYDLYSNELNKLWQYNFSSYGILYKANNDFYLGLHPNLIFNAGIDLTCEIIDDYFITAEATLLKNYELIFQKRNKVTVGFTNTIGIIYRSDRLTFIENSLSNKPIFFNTNSIGIRSLNGFNLFNNKMLVEISLLYELEYKAELINISFSYNIYNLFY
ncbi:MAG: hypothetical protein B6D44_01895 [Ignavibacteriales bacterium UTCHB2]|jgi:hypothetical protein|nr:MAG: hypothetical protein BWY38_00663 [Ignavibacteria bacterium ADurb.Bin266]OQY75316.1 MAG: hypothetical protein B6D44_01895 [Ignavibacteriales bacterium UTCHB2]HQI41768.1 hypothetical protein [Ignavibacteriaceae bacterium]